jgi:hypothetical protein
MFWHLVGFWDFMTKFVIGDVGLIARLPAQMAAPTTRDLEQRILRLAERRGAAACSELALDRMSGVTSLLECQPDSLSVPHKPVAVRGDRMKAAPVTATNNLSPVWPAKIDAAALFISHDD